MKIPPTVRASIIARAESCCERCGRWCDTAEGRYSLQHRVARQMGGSRVVDGAARLAFLCGHATEPGRCHYEVESGPQQAIVDGWRVPQGCDPALVPIRHHEHGLVLLDETYGYAEVAA